MPRCCVFGCSKTTNTDLGVSIHQFPNRVRSPVTFKAWLNRVNRLNFQPTRSSVVCSEHFTPEDFEETPRLKKELLGLKKCKPVLKKGAIPSLKMKPARQKNRRKTKASIRKKKIKEAAEEQCGDFCEFGLQCELGREIYRDVVNCGISESDTENNMDGFVSERTSESTDSEESKIFPTISSEYVNPAAEKSIDKLPTDAENYVEIKLEGDAESGDAVYEEMEDSSEELILQDDHDSVDQDSLSVRENFPCLVEPTSTQSYVSFNNIQKAKVMSDRRAILPTIQIEKDEYEIFGQCIAAQLRNLKDPYARAKAKFHIQKALFEAETENYKPQNS